MINPASSVNPLTITYKPTKDLKPNPRNPRKHPKPQIRQLAESIKGFGFLIPIVIDGLDNIIAGHGCVLAAQLLGLENVPTVMVTHLSKAQVKAFTIAANRLAENSEWDEDLLAETLQELSEMDLGFSIETTGFTMGEIDLSIEGLPEKKGKADSTDTLPELPTRVVTQLGDIWLLDKHRLLCGNALDASAFNALMQDKQAGTVFTDPPYNVRIDGHATGLGNIRHREFAMASGEMDTEEFTAFLTNVCTLLVRFSTEGSIHFLCMDWRHVGELLAAGKAKYSALKNICLWVKDNAGMGSLYRSQHELVAVFKNGRSPHRNNVQLGKYGRYRTNVWRYPCANTMSRSSEEGNLLALHPTVKPVAMVADAILDVSARGDIVLDPFLGSGTTLMAAERTGRVCHGMELDPLYVDTAIRRWQKYTGGSAIHAISGKSFDTLAAEAEASHDR